MKDEEVRKVEKERVLIFFESGEQGTFVEYVGKESSSVLTEESYTYDGFLDSIDWLKNQGYDVSHIDEENKEEARKHLTT